MKQVNEDKLISEAYMKASNFVGPANEFRNHIGKAINSLTVLKESRDIDDKERLENALADLHELMRYALYLEDEFSGLAEKEPNFP